MALLAAADSADHRPDLFPGRSPQYGVHLGNFLKDLFLIPLGQTSRHNQGPAPALLFLLGHLQDGVHALLLRIADKAAGIDEDDIRLSLVIGKRDAHVPDQTQHLFRIYQVFIASQRHAE